MRTSSNNETKKTPFFARKAEGKPLVIKTNLKAGKAGAVEQDSK